MFKARLPVDKMPMPRARRLCGQSKMNFVSLVTHGLSAISVFGEQVNTRLLVATSAAGAVTLLGLAAVAAIRFGTSAAIPGWATYSMGLLVVVFLNALSLSLMFSLSILQARNNTAFLPLRDAQYYISEIQKVAARPASQNECLRRAA